MRFEMEKVRVHCECGSGQLINTLESTKCINCGRILFASIRLEVRGNPSDEYLESLIEKENKFHKEDFWNPAGYVRTK